MRTNAQLLRGLVVAETIGELVRDPLGVAVVEGDVQQLFAVHGVPIFVIHLADDFVRNGVLTEAGAVALARQVLRENVQRIFNV